MSTRKRRQSLVFGDENITPNKSPAVIEERSSQKRHKRQTPSSATKSQRRQTMLFETSGIFSDDDKSSRNSTGKRNTRRETAGSFELADLLASMEPDKLDSSALSDMSTSDMMGSESIHKRNTRRETADSLELADLISSAEDSERDATAGRNQRRETFDPADIANLLSEVSAVTSPNSSLDDCTFHTDEEMRARRLTADTSTLAEMLKMLDSSHSDDAILEKESPLGEHSKAEISAIARSLASPTEQSLMNVSVGSAGTVDTNYSLLGEVNELLQETVSPGADVIAQKESSKKTRRRSTRSSLFPVDAIDNESGTAVSVRRSPRINRQFGNTPSSPAAISMDVAAVSSTPPPVEFIVSDGPPASILKSCLQKSVMQSGRRSVAFGSPRVAEFNKLSPTTRLTPMIKDRASAMFSMEEADSEDEETADNSQILSEWERLSYHSEEGENVADDSDETNAYAEEAFSSPGGESPSVSLASFMDEPQANNLDQSYTVELPRSLSELVAEAEENEPSDEVGAGSDRSDIQLPTEFVDLSAGDISQTVELAENLQDLVSSGISPDHHNINHSSDMLESSRTVQLPSHLKDLVSESTSFAVEENEDQTSTLVDESHTVELVDSLQELVSSETQFEISQFIANEVSAEYDVGDDDRDESMELVPQSSEEEEADEEQDDEPAELVDAPAANVLVNASLQLAASAIVMEPVTASEEIEDLVQDCRQALNRSKFHRRSSLARAVSAMDTIRPVGVESVTEDLTAKLHFIRGRLEERRAELSKAEEDLLEAKRQRTQTLIGILNNAENQQPTESLSQYEQQLAVLEQQVDIINRLSYCRLKVYQTDMIALDVILSRSVRASLNFRLECSEGIFSVSGVEVELIVDSHLLPNGDHQREISLCQSFFAHFLCNNDICGPLSERTLSAVTKPTEIQSVVQRATGFIASLRAVLQDLNHYYGHRWAPIGGKFLKLDLHAAVVALLPLSALVSKDVSQVSTQCLKRVSDGASVFEPEVATILGHLTLEKSGVFPHDELLKRLNKLVETL